MTLCTAMFIRLWFLDQWRFLSIQKQCSKMPFFPDMKKIQEHWKCNLRSVQQWLGFLALFHTMDGCFCTFVCMCVLVHAYTIFLCVYVSIFQQGILHIWKVWKSKQLFLIIPSISITACKRSNEESQELCMPPAVSLLRNSCSLSEPSSFLSSRSRTSSKVMIFLNSSECERMPFQALCSFLIFPFRKLELKVFLHFQIFFCITLAAIMTNEFSSFIGRSQTNFTLKAIFFSFKKGAYVYVSDWIVSLEKEKLQKFRRQHEIYKTLISILAYSFPSQMTKIHSLGLLHSTHYLYEGLYWSIWRKFIQVLRGKGHIIVIAFILIVNVFLYTFMCNIYFLLYIAVW